jgi:hypothetical protein
VALEDFRSDLTFISKGSAKLARKLSEFEGSTEIFAGMVASEIIDDAYAILLEELRAAIAQSQEYDYPEFSEKLIEVFSRPGIITITKDTVDIYSGAIRVAGDWGDLWMGVNAARAALGVGKLDKGRALAFWRERIYRPAREGLKRPRLFKKNKGFYRGAGRGERIPFDYSAYGIMKYGTTLDARLTLWGEKAPYWLWLHFGNTQKGGGGYPTVRPTFFVRTAEKKIDALYRQEIIRIVNEFTEAVSREVQQFLQHPEAYTPGQELAVFEAASGSFRLGVTPTGQLGVRRIS